MYKSLLFIICVQAMISLSGCVDTVFSPPSAAIVKISVVSVGLEAAYPLADLWMARDAEFGAKTVQGGGSDSSIWVEKAVPPSVVDEYVRWVIHCAKSIDGIISVVVEVDGEVAQIWRKPVQLETGESVVVLIQVMGNDPAGFASRWSPERFQAVPSWSSRDDGTWTFELPEAYIEEFIRHVSFVGSYGKLAHEYGITEVGVWQVDGEKTTRIGCWIGE